MLAIGFFSGAVLAYEDEKLEEVCKKPKFHDFSLPVYHEPEKLEVPPEAEFEFKISSWSNPDTIKLTAKKEKVPFTVESNSSFHRVKAKLPASLNGKYARIDASVKAILGCDEQAGWLVKIADKPGATPPTASPAPAKTEPAVSAPTDTPASSDAAVAPDNTESKAESQLPEPASAEAPAPAQNADQ